jgi:formylglycine-generating enzyme required for sulfatase activity
VVTSRYAGYRTAEGIELHTDHLRADVLDLDEHQQRTFLKKWFAAAYKEELEISDRSPADAEQEIATQAQEVVDGVLQYLEREENAGLRRMAGTPVLLQIMAVLWKEFGNLPPSRADLYERCTDYLLDRRDFVKGLPVFLPADQAKIVLRPVCLWMQEIRKSDEATIKELEEKMALRLEEVKPGLKPRAFMKNLRDRAGIIQTFGDDGYIFRHKSFREFLAATQLVEEVKSNPRRVSILVNNFADGWWRETLVFALSLPRPAIFSEFMERYLPHSHNTAGFPPLLEQVIKEARHKPVASFNDFVLDQKTGWQQRYNALQCLRLIASDPAKALVRKVWKQEKNSKVKQKAQEMLVEWQLLEVAIPEPARVVLGATGAKGKVSWRNPDELNAEYILIPGAAEKVIFKRTGKPAPDYPLYFAKYPLTNKLYRRFSDYLAEKETMQEALSLLPRRQFAASLLKKTEETKDFAKYLGSDPSGWAETLRSRYDDDKRFNGGDQPVVGVTWFAAVAYCHWLTELERAKSGERGAQINPQSRIPDPQLIFRLPAEEEWEWAAGSGKREYPWGNQKPDDTRANYGGRVGQTTPVGAYPAGAIPESLMDMAGNVWEWCENWYKDETYGARALRGGSWVDDDEDLRCSARHVGVHPDNQWHGLGFRVVVCQA